MNNLRLTLRISAVCAFALLFLSGAQAQAVRRWVSGEGDDLNRVVFRRHRKTFAGAISKTNTGGEITVKDAGGFGTVIIRKSITIDGTGVPASILANQGTG